MNRRTFLLAGGSVLAVRAAPSDQINLGVIGSGGRGTFVMTVVCSQNQITTDRGGVLAVNGRR
jgi:hypothetical protein